MKIRSGMFSLKKTPNTAFSHSCLNTWQQIPEWRINSENHIELTGFLTKVYIYQSPLHYLDKAVSIILHIRLAIARYALKAGKQVHFEKITAGDQTLSRISSIITLK